MSLVFRDLVCSGVNALGACLALRQYSRLAASCLARALHYIGIIKVVKVGAATSVNDIQCRLALVLLLA